MFGGLEEVGAVEVGAFGEVVEAGVLVQNIDQADICTSCDRSFFYSYRAADGRTGRLAAGMELR